MQPIYDIFWPDKKELNQIYFNRRVASYISSPMIYRFIYFPLIHRALYCRFPQNTPRRSTVNLTLTNEICWLDTKWQSFPLAFCDATDTRDWYERLVSKCCARMGTRLGITEWEDYWERDWCPTLLEKWCAQHLATRLYWELQRINTVSVVGLKYAGADGCVKERTQHTRFEWIRRYFSVYSCHANERTAAGLIWEHSFLELETSGTILTTV